MCFGKRSIVQTPSSKLEDESLTESRKPHVIEALKETRVQTNAQKCDDELKPLM